MTAGARLRPQLAALLLVSLVGAADVATFIATNPATAMKTGGRAAGSLAGLATWVLLLTVTGRRMAGDGPRLSTATIGLAALAAVGGVGLATVHQLAGVGGPRTIAGGLLGLAALGLAASARREPDLPA